MRTDRPGLVAANRGLTPEAVRATGAAIFRGDVAVRAGLADRIGTRWRKPHLIRNSWLRWGLIAGAVVYTVLAVGSIEVNWSRVSEGLVRGWAFVASFFTPDFLSRGGEIHAVSAEPS